MAYFAKRFFAQRFFAKRYWSSGETTPGIVSLTGEEITTAQGALKPLIEVALAGQAITSAQGALTPDVGGGSASVELTGQVVSSTGGALVPELDVPLVGQAVTGTAGALGVEGEVVGVLVGQVVTSAVGVLVPTVEVTLVGLRIVTSVGMFRQVYDAPDYDLFVQKSIDELVAYAEVIELTCANGLNVEFVAQQETDEELVSADEALWVLADEVDMSVVSLPIEQMVEETQYELFAQIPDVAMFVVDGDEDDIATTTEINLIAA